MVSSPRVRWMTSPLHASAPSRCHLSRTSWAVSPPTSTPSTRVRCRVVLPAAAAMHTARYAAARTPTAIPAAIPAIRPAERVRFSFCKGFWSVFSIRAPPHHSVAALLRVRIVYYISFQKRLQSGNNRRFFNTLLIYVRARLGIRMVSRISCSVSRRSHPASTPA